MSLEFVARGEQPSLSHLLERHDHIQLVAKNLRYLNEQALDAIESASKSGKRIEVLTHDPADRQLQKVILPASRERGSDEHRTRLEDFLTGVGVDVEVRLVNWPLYSGVTICRAQARTREVYFEPYGYRLANNEKLGLQLRLKEDAALIDSLRRQFRDQWVAGRNPRTTQPNNELEATDNE